MVLIVTMAGLYERFRERGVDFPKYLLPWGESPILSRVLSELLKDGAFDSVYLVANVRDEPYMPHVRAVLKRLGIPLDHLILTGDTRGQAETGMIGLSAAVNRGVGKDEPFAFHNIDTILLNRDLRKFREALLSSDGHLDVFRATSANYSYVRVEGNQVSEIVEKKPISEIATSGLYGFRNAGTFKKYYELSDDRYISSMYARMLADSARITAGDLHRSEDTLVLGTLEEYLKESANL